MAAWELAKAAGPLKLWTGTRERILASWLANALGAPKLSKAIHSLAWRADRKDSEACACRAHGILHRYGPLATWTFLEHARNTIAHRPEADAYLFSIRALVASYFRDFETANAWMVRAESLNADKPWVVLTRAYQLEHEDRYEEALAAAKKCRELAPNYRNGFHGVAHCLRLLNRNEEAEAELIQGVNQVNHASLVSDLAQVQIDLGKFAAASVTLDRFVSMSPLMEKAMEDWVRALRLLIACKRRDLGPARQLAKSFEDDCHKQLSARLESSTTEFRQRHLKVHFVRQHHMTCAPATLSALSTYWSKRCEHLELAEAICYDGTPSHSERKWAADNGWVAREFTVTWDAAVALLDRGVPFTLTTTEATSGHLQAVVGYDELRGSFIIRDPYRYAESEFLVEQLLRRYRSTGPRGMVIVPKERAEILDGLNLPDADAYDVFNDFLSALQLHDRKSAETALSILNSRFVGHRLTLSGQRALASYDANTPALLIALERLLEIFPDDAGLLLSKINCLRELGRRTERLELLDLVTAKPACEPVFFAVHSNELRTDAREIERATFFCRRALRRQPMDASHLACWADLLWDQQRFSEALEYYRIAACLEDKRENFSRALFIASRHLRQTERALAVLFRRFERFGKKSFWPAVTLAESLDQLERTPEAFSVLERAVAMRPDDGDLILYVAEFNARHARPDESASCLARASGISRRANWLRASARLADLRNDRPAALAQWRELEKSEPTSVEVHRQIALLRAESEGRAAAIGHLERVCAAVPHNLALGQLRVEWLRDEGPKEWERGARALLAINSADAWSQRELALALSQQSRWDEALAAADEAVSLEPVFTTGFSVRGAVRRDAGRIEDAIKDFRQAIKFSVDNGMAVNSLLSLLPTIEDKRAALRFIQCELERQVVFGEGLLAFRESGRGIFSREEMRVCLQAALDARPDLWQAWSALTNHSIELDDLLTADALSREATERFPLLARLWLDRGQVCRANSDAKGERQAQEQALALAPDWALASRVLASTIARGGDFDRALQVLERACSRNPLDAENHAELARVLWSLQRKEDAIQELKTAIELNPGYEWHWGLLGEWGTATKRPEMALQTARELVSRRGGDARSWIILARMMHGREPLRNVLATLDTALERNPRSIWAYDTRAEFAARGGLKQEALDACNTAVWEDKPPLELQSRAAWVLAHFGEVDTAIKQMQALLQNHPDYNNGWKMFAEWLWNAGREDDALKAVDRMAILLPFNCVPHGYRAAAKLRRNDREGAISDLRKALELDPGYEYAANNLFDILLDKRDYEGAGQILSLIRKHQSKDNALAREIKLQSLRSNTTTGTNQAAATLRPKHLPPQSESARQRLDGEGLETALNSFRALAVSTDSDGRALEQAFATLIGAGVTAELDELLNEMIDHPDANPQIGALWVRRRAAKQDFALRDSLLKLRERGEIGRRAIISYVTCLGSAGESKALKSLLDEHENWLAIDEWGWDATAIALGSVKNWRRLCEWARNWRDHLTATPLALHHALIALHKDGRYSDAFNLASAASGRAGPGRGFEPLLAWAALEHSIRGDVSKARDALAKMDRESLDDYTHRIQRLARAVVTITTSEARSRASAWKAADELVQRATQGIKVSNSDRPFKRAYFQACLRMAKAGHKPWRILAAVWRTNKPVLMGVLCVVAVIGIVGLIMVAGSAATSGGSSSYGTYYSPLPLVFLVLLFRMFSRRN